MDGFRTDAAFAAVAPTADPLEFGNLGQSGPLDTSRHGLRPAARRRTVAVLLAVTDMVVLVATMRLVATPLAAFGLSPAEGLPDFVHAFGVAAPLFVLLGLAFGLYGCQGLAPFERFRIRVRVALLFFAASAVIGALVPALILPLLLFAPAAALLTILFGWWAETALRHGLTRRSMWAAPVVILGCGAVSRALAAKLLGRPELGLRPVGFLDDGEEGAAPATPGLSAGLPILGSLADAGRLAALVDIAIAPQPVAARLAASGLFDRLPFARLVIVPDLMLQTMCTGLRSLGDAIGLDVRRCPAPMAQRWTKRAIDVAIAGPLLVLAVPVILIVAACIRAVSPGSAFYAQPRVGFGGRPLLVPKLRSMYPDAERRLQDHLASNPDARAEWERFVKLSRDPRVLPLVGSFIRRASLDELPQLWNIVCGGMSLVGPRPFPTYHVSRFDAEFQTLRTTVPPGLTGLWQVSSRSEGDLEKQKEQDSFYIRNWSLLLDLYILVQTLPAVIFAKGAK